MALFSNVMFNCNPITLSPCNPITLSPYHSITLALCHTIASGFILTGSPCYSRATPTAQRQIERKRDPCHPRKSSRPPSQKISRTNFRNLARSNARQLVQETLSTDLDRSIPRRALKGASARLMCS